ncbi:MAG: nitrous oxide reductase accessory protein NosL [Proteobacteria bacterium]|nr:nitrous oxide reductase accessory protein NosL [Pseudomonadota bacterium]MBU1686610.1 nitrous oxide reductase accessory protein NosL [Pseudomonadota bacterium]
MLKNQMFLFGMVVMLTISALLFPAISQGAPQDTVDGAVRCPVCGMFVAKYPGWIAQIALGSNDPASFDGVKDMMAYYFAPTKFGGQPLAENAEVWVKDYYSLKWLDGRQAFFVLGSDVHGPMGHELIPFSSKAAAESFLVDHHGQRIVTFSEITSELITRLRSGQTMKPMK